MAFALYTQSFGSTYANTDVKIVETSTGNPAIVLNSIGGGVLSTQGVATLDGSGNLSVYIDTAKTWTINTVKIAALSTSGLTDAQLRATPVPVSGSFSVTGGLTDTQLRAAPVPVSGSVSVTGGLTDTQLRATPVAMASSDLGTAADAAASADTGTFSLIALVKRWLAKLPSTIGVRPITDSLSVAVNSDTTVTGPSAQSAINTDLLTGTVSGWYDAGAYHSGAIQIIASAGISAGAIIFEQTNDSTLAASGSNMPIQEPATVANSSLLGAITISASTTRMFTFPILARYVRCKVSTAFVGGTVQAVGVFSQLPWVSPAIQSLQPTAANLNVTVAQATSSNLNAQIVGNIAEDAASTSSPVMVGGIVRTSTAPTTLVAGDAARLTISSAAQLVVKPYAVAETDWQITGSITTSTTAAAAKAAGAAGIRNYVTGIQAQNTSATATTLLIQDGATTIWQCNLPATMATPIVVPFSTPLRGTAATAMNYNFGTASATVLLNIQGYQSV